MKGREVNEQKGNDSIGARENKKRERVRVVES